MLNYTINDLKKISCIQKIVTVVRNDESKIKGILTKITAGSICVQEIQSGLEINIPDHCIMNLRFDDNEKQSYDLFNRLNNMKRKYDKISDDARITLFGVFKEKIEMFANVCENPVLKSYIKTEETHRAAKYNINELNNIYEDFVKNTKEKYKENIVINIIESMLLLRMKRVDEAYFCIIQAAEKFNIDDIFLICTCLGIHSNNSMEAIYWLHRFFSQTKAENIVNMELWWYYLRMTSIYSLYDQIIPVMKYLAKKDPLLALESLIYLLVSNNHTGIAANLLDYTDHNPSTEIVHNFIDCNSCFLVTDEDNNYHRFLRCINTIINQKDIRLYDDKDYINGYIYDYIPDRGYGFIIGFDLVVYFFRTESVKSNNLHMNIKNNICSMSHVKDEDLVMVTFKRSRESKISFNATDII